MHFLSPGGRRLRSRACRLGSAITARAAALGGGVDRADPGRHAGAAERRAT
ncbi:MAG: hypothetical protein MZW92_04050 [Comamonadaceae bacterium]|nr:hypothetical protein [Comamonadaceae bacterium]